MSVKSVYMMTDLEGCAGVDDWDPRHHDYATTAIAPDSVEFHFQEFSTNISNFDYSYLPIIITFLFIGIIIKSSRQQILYKQIGVNIPFKTSILLFISGLSMILTPGGSGELIKSYYLKRRFDYPLAKTFPAVIIERLQDLTAVVGILLIIGLILDYN